MAKKRHTPEQVIDKLREAEVAIAEGGTVAECGPDRSGKAWLRGSAAFRRASCILAEGAAKVSDRQHLSRDVAVLVLLGGCSDGSGVTEQVVGEQFESLSRAVKADRGSTGDHGESIAKRFYPVQDLLFVV